MAEHKRPDLMGTRRKQEIESREARRARLVMARIFKKVLSTPDGKVVFNELMEMCMVFRPTMTGNSYTYYNEGKRSVGLEIMMMREQGWEQEVLLRRAEALKNLTPKNEED